MSEPQCNMEAADKAGRAVTGGSRGLRRPRRITSDAASS